MLLLLMLLTLLLLLKCLMRLSHTKNRNTSPLPPTDTDKQTNKQTPTNTSGFNTFAAYNNNFDLRPALAFLTPPQQQQQQKAGFHTSIPTICTRKRQSMVIRCNVYYNLITVCLSISMHQHLFKKPFSQ